MKNKIGLSITLAILILTMGNVIIYMIYDRPLHMITNIALFVLASIQVYNRIRI